MPKHPKSVNFKTFKGINNVVSPESTNPSYLKKAINVNIDKTGGVSKRKGYVKVDSANYTSLWASDNGLGCYAVRNSNLVRLDGDYTSHSLVNNVGSDPISFEEVDGLIYYTSNSVNGIIGNYINRSWGLPKNTLAPTLSSTVGSLAAGTYQVSFTFVTNDFRESGTIPASKITVTANSGIVVNIPTNSDPAILYARIYCSTSNGTVLYYAGMSNIGTNYTISTSNNLVNPLRVFNIDKAPLGHIVKYYRGRMYVAQDNVLWYSEPHQYEYFNLGSNFFEFPSRITEVMPVEDGIWIGSDSLYYLSGDDPERFKRSTKERVKIIEGTAARVSGSYIHIDNTPIGYKWLVSSDLGIWILFNQGMVINTTSENVELIRADSGTSLFLRDGGMNQYISILKTNQNANNSVMGDLVESRAILNGRIFNDNFAVTDVLTSTLVRNGITIP